MNSNGTLETTYLTQRKPIWEKRGTEPIQAESQNRQVTHTMSLYVVCRRRGSHSTHEQAQHTMDNEPCSANKTVPKRQHGFGTNAVPRDREGHLEMRKGKCVRNVSPCERTCAVENPPEVLASLPSSPARAGRLTAATNGRSARTAVPGVLGTV